MKRIKRLHLLAALWLGLLAAPVHASFHLIDIVEVFPGTVKDPTAQYLVLESYFAGQTFVAAQPVTFFDRNGNNVGTVTFAANSGNSASQAKLLVATPSAATLFNITPDLTMGASIIASGGRACWAGTIDCVAWGDDNPTPSDAALVGTPFSKPYGLSLGDAMLRRLDIVGGATTLDTGDDTNNCKNDFIAGLPAPKNNANQSGTIPASTCGNAVLEGLEQCDDGAANGFTNCDVTCRLIPDGVFRDNYEGF
jgi:hypothetical protein